MSLLGTKRKCWARWAFPELGQIGRTVSLPTTAALVKVFGCRPRTDPFLTLWRPGVRRPSNGGNRGRGTQSGAAGARPMGI
jgi:hypothetical protein